VANAFAKGKKKVGARRDFFKKEVGREAMTSRHSWVGDFRFAGSETRQLNFIAT
jgi:hypothetical protein